MLSIDTSIFADIKLIQISEVVKLQISCEFSEID